MSFILAALLGWGILAQPLAENEMILEVDRLNRESTLNDPTTLYCNLPSDWGTKRSESRVAFRQLTGEDAAQVREAYLDDGMLMRSHPSQTSMFRVLPSASDQWPQVVKDAFAASGLDAGRIGSVTFAPLWYYATSLPIDNVYIKFNDWQGSEIETVHYSSREARLTKCAAQTQPLPPPPLIKAGIEGLWYRIHTSTIDQILTRLSAHIDSRYGCCANLGNTVALYPADGAYLVLPSPGNNYRRGVDVVFTVLDQNNAATGRGECNFNFKVEGTVAVYESHSCKDLPLPEKPAPKFGRDRVSNALRGVLHDGEIVAIHRQLDKHGLLFESDTLLDFEQWEIDLKNSTDPNIQLIYNYKHPSRGHRGRCKFKYQTGLIPFLVDSSCSRL